MPADTREEEVRDLFHKCGFVANIILVDGPQGTVDAVVDYDSAKSAELALKRMPNTEFRGHTLQVTR